MASASMMTIASPRPIRWTRDAYYRMGDAGLFIGMRVQLIDGGIVEMSPQGFPHSLTITLVSDELHSAFGPGHWIRIQMPLTLGENSEPEPDVAVVAGQPRDLRDHPSTALLVVEVSDSTYALDLGKKASLYAAAGIRNYWILDLGTRRLVSLRNPKRDATAPFGWRYSESVFLGPKRFISPLAKPDTRIRIADLLP